MRNHIDLEQKDFAPLVLKLVIILQACPIKQGY